MYRRISGNYQRTRQASEICAPVPLIAGGDIFTVEDALEMQKKTNCSGITVARGLVRNPFLIQTIKAELKHFSTIQNNKDPVVSLLRTMCKIALKRPELYRKTAFIETAALAWGKNSRKFRKTVQILSRKDLLQSAAVRRLSDKA
jgi:tRNA-dihydrouridine synthase